ncbi:hypothetical protein HFN89_05110 [Rhizobium laguerreae]|nr:hypothetical protein [Rhizobium laguerreae]
MKASFFYPMIGSGQTRLGRTDKIGMVIGRWTVEVQETTTEETPVALCVFRDGKQSYGVRWYEGAHYRSFPTEEGVVQEQDGGLRVIGLTKRLETFLGNRMQEDIFRGKSRQSYYPDGIASAQTVTLLQSGICGLDANWHRPDDHFVFDEEGMSEAERWRALAEQAASCLLIVDGTLWEKCEEPIYKIATRASPGIEILGGRPLAATRREPILANTDADDRLFNALEYELALDAKAKAEKYRKQACKEETAYIDVFVPQAVRYQSAEGELRRLARLLVQEVEFEIAAATKKSAINWSHLLSTSVIGAWNEVRCAENCFDLPGGQERLEEAVTAIVDILKPLDARMNILRDEDVHDLLSRWQDREISVESIPLIGTARGSSVL